MGLTNKEEAKYSSDVLSEEEKKLVVALGLNPRGKFTKNGFESCLMREDGTNVTLENDAIRFLLDKYKPELKEEKVEIKLYMTKGDYEFFYREPWNDVMQSFYDNEGNIDKNFKFIEEMDREFERALNELK